MGLDEQQKQYIERLYFEMYHPLSVYAQSALDDRSLAEEAVQDTFRIACAKVDELISSANSKGWLTVTLKHVIRNILRTRARLSRLIVASLDPAECASGAAAEETDIDFEYSDLISREDYDLLKKIVFEKYTLLEAALELGISVEACKKRLQRSRKKLQEKLKDK